jgi:hypothetical protein
MESILVRAKLWELGLRGIGQSTFPFILGMGDFGKVNLIQWAGPEEFKSNHLAFRFDSGFFQTHLHSDYIGLLYGAGGIALAFYILNSMFSVNQLVSRETEPKEKLFSVVMIAFSFHALTEPILMSVYSSFLYWITFLFLFKTKMTKTNIAPRYVHFLKLFLTGILFLLVTLFLFANFLERPSLQFILNHPHFKKEVRGFDLDLTKVTDKDREALGFVISNLDYQSSKVSFYPGSLENRADAYLLHALYHNLDSSYQKSSQFYCQLFDRQPTPRHYNNLRNLGKRRGLSLELICDRNLSEKIKNYDKHQLISADFY